MALRQDIIIRTSSYFSCRIFSLPAFTDCHALDATRWRFNFLSNIVLEYSNYKEKKMYPILDVDPKNTYSIEKITEELKVF